MIKSRDELTPREQAQMAHDREMFELQRAQVLEIKQIELEVSKLEAKFSSWLKLPLAILMLPVKIVVAVGVLIYAVRGFELDTKVYELLKK